MPPIVVGIGSQAKNDTNSDDLKIGDSDRNIRQPRQLAPGGWTPIPAVWSPRPRPPLNTWWAMPWAFENPQGLQSLVRIQPPSPYWQDYRHNEHDDHHHHHHHHVS